MGYFLLLFRIVLCSLLLLFHFPSFSSSSSSSHSLAPLCHPDQSSALLQFKNLVVPNNYVDYHYPWEYLQCFPKTITWENGTDCCSWLGVTCDSTSGHVIGLNLTCSGLHGKFQSISSSFSNLTHLTSLILSGNNLNGSIPLSFSNLQHLTFLDLSLNELSGSIPSSLSNLQLVTHLDLSSNKLSGSIPSSLSSLQNLTYLDLSSNELSGSIPSSFSNLQQLIHLNLSHNQLSGQIPYVLGGLTKLQSISIQKNNLGGQLPSSLFTLPQLLFLDCSYNKFQGDLPNKISGLSNLTLLNLSNNLLNGTIPSWCFSLPSLGSLYLAHNQFTGHVGEISSSLGELFLCGNKLSGNVPESVLNLVSLTYLCLSANYDNDRPVHFSLFSKLQNLVCLLLSGYNSLSLKTEIGFPNLLILKLVSCNLIDDSEASGKFPKLKFLRIVNCNLQGEVPGWIRDMDSLTHLELSGNLLTSVYRFPWYNLVYLDLASNLITDDISSLICNATSLTMIKLARNKLTGTFPQCLANFTDLRVLDLEMNKLHGTLPNTFSMNKDLMTLNLNGNQFEGLLPQSLSNCTNLIDLNLGNNQIADTFPHWLQNLPNLGILVLRANKLYGPIVSLKNEDPFPKLTTFDISCNNFSGPMPDTYIKKFQAMGNGVEGEVKGNLQYMKSYYGAVYGNIVPEYDDSMTATIKGVSTNFMKIPTVFVNVDLSVNKFEGEIPNVIGELHGLKGLNLSHNRLTGPIPHSMGNLTSLESLDLSSNMLTGGIPIELTSLNSLEVLNLSHNNLVGEIPQGKQFNTFSNDSYEGNMGLCGLPMSMQCNKDLEHQSPSLPIFPIEEKFGFGWKPVAVGYGCGMVLGVGLGCCVLLTGKPQWLVRMVGGDPNNQKGENYDEEEERDEDSWEPYKNELVEIGHN